MTFEEFFNKWCLSVPLRDVGLYNVVIKSSTKGVPYNTIVEFHIGDSCAESYLVSGIPTQFKDWQGINDEFERSLCYSKSEKSLKRQTALSKLTEEERELLGY